MLLVSARGGLSRSVPVTAGSRDGAGVEVAGNGTSACLSGVDDGGLTEEEGGTCRVAGDADADAGAGAGADADADADGLGVVGLIRLEKGRADTVLSEWL